MTAEAKQNGRMTNQAVKSSTSTWRAIRGREGLYEVRAAAVRRSP